MGARYIITGVQLGMLIAIPDLKDRQKIGDDIINDQFFENSDKSINEDLLKYRQQFCSLFIEDIKEMRKRHDQEIESLRNQCKHKKLTDWMEQQWAPGHSTGKQVKVCKFCEKIIKEK